MIKILPPFYISIEWELLDGQKVQTKHYNRKDNNQFITIKIPLEIEKLYKIKIDGTCRGIDLTELEPSIITDFGNLGESYYTIKAGNSKLQRLPDRLPDSFTSLEESFQNSTYLNDKNIEKWNTSNIRNFINSFNNCTVFNRNLTCWDVSTLTFQNLGSNDVPSERSPLWGQNKSDTTNRNGLACTPFNLRILGNESIIQNFAGFYESAYDADLNDSPLEWSLEQLQGEVQKFQVNSNLVALTSTQEARALLKIKYDDGMYNKEATKLVRIVRTIDIIQPPTITSLGCGSIIFITVNILGRTDDLIYHWVQTSGATVEIDNPNSLTMGFVRPNNRPTLGQYEEYSFRLTISGPTVLTREVDVFVSNIPITALNIKIGSINNFTSIKPTKYTVSTNINITPNAAFGFGAKISFTTSTSSSWYRTDILVLVNNEWLLYNFTTKPGFNEISVDEQYVYVLLDRFKDGSTRTNTIEEVYRHPNYYKVGHILGNQNLEYIDEYRYPNKYIYVNSEFSSKVSILEEKINFVKVFTDYRRIFIAVESSYYKNSNSIIENNTVHEKVNLDIEESKSEFESFNINLSLILDKSSMSIQRFDRRFIEG